MQGYLTMADEAADQLEGRVPTHIFLQAGVGAMAGALTAYFRSRYGFGPRIVIVEPDKADCGYRTALANDGRLHRVEGALDTIMAGLACGEPCTIGWELLHYGADAFLSTEDAVAATGNAGAGALRLPTTPASSPGKAGRRALGLCMRSWLTGPGCGKRWGWTGDPPFSASPPKEPPTGRITAVSSGTALIPLRRRPNDKHITSNRRRTP